MVLARTLVSLLRRGGDLVQLGTIRQLDLLGADHDERDPTRLIRLVDPLVSGAALDDELARFDRPLVPTIQPQRDLAVQHDGIVETQRSVHRHGEAGWDIRDAEGDAGRWAARYHVG